MRYSGEGKGLTCHMRPVWGRGECGKFSRSQATPGKGLNVPGKPADGTEFRSQSLSLRPRSLLHALGTGCSFGLRERV